MIRKAKLSDLDRIMEIISEAVAEMKSYGNTQWDENYPSNETFITDINNNSLYVYEEDNLIKGLVCIDTDEDEEIPENNNDDDDEDTTGIVDEFDFDEDLEKDIDEEDEADDIDDDFDINIDDDEDVDDEDDDEEVFDDDDDDLL